MLKRSAGLIVSAPLDPIAVGAEELKKPGMVLDIVQACKSCVASGPPCHAAPAISVIELQGLMVCASDSAVLVVPATVRIRATPSECLNIFSAQALLTDGTFAQWMICDAQIGSPNSRSV